MEKHGFVSGCPLSRESRKQYRHSKIHMRFLCLEAYPFSLFPPERFDRFAERLAAAHSKILQIPVAEPSQFVALSRPSPPNAQQRGDAARNQPAPMMIGLTRRHGAQRPWRRHAHAGRLDQNLGSHGIRSPSRREEPPTAAISLRYPWFPLSLDRRSRRPNLECAVATFKKNGYF